MTADIYRCSLVRESEIEYGNLVSPKDVWDVCELLGMCDAAEEYLYMFSLNTKGNVVGIHEISHGILDASLVHPREIYKRALLNNANSIIIAHNHPSGDLTPGEDDIVTTERLKDAGKILGITLLDHIIVGTTGYYSFMEG